MSSGRREPIEANGGDDALSGPAPEFGQHGPAVLQELLGLSADEVARLRACGALLGGD